MNLIYSIKQGVRQPQPGFLKLILCGSSVCVCVLCVCVCVCVCACARVRVHARGY